MRFFLKIQKPLLLILLVLSARTLAAQDKTEFEKGVVTAAVQVRGSEASQNYALYLPKNYTPAKQWAILYCFDPMGRGRTPVGIFQAAAEKHGMIVVGSNDSRNGLDGNSLAKIFQNLWADTHDRFSIDDRRIYAAGFSGGARVATLLAVSCRGCLSGVIGAGAGLTSQIKPGTPLPFLYFGAAGADDFNYAEIYDLDKTLTEAKHPHRIEIFEGGHEWFSGATAERALAWLRLHEMKSGKIERNDEFISELFSFRADEARSLLATSGKQLFQAYRHYLNLIEDFKGLRDVTEFVRAVENLKSSKEFKKALRDEEDQIQQQRENEKKFYGIAAKLSNLEELASSRQELNDFVVSLKKKSQQPADDSERRIARRTLGGLFIGSIEAALQNYKPKKQYRMAILSLETALLINEKAPGAWFELARIYSLDNRRKKALEALTKAIENGLSDAALLERTTDFDTIRHDEDFVRISARLKSAVTN